MTVLRKPTSNSSSPIHEVNLSEINEEVFLRRCVGCIVLNHKGKILLQQRDADSPTYPGCLATFGGGIDAGESPIQALIRELKEELGAEVIASDVISLGAITSGNNKSELIHVYFWHDKKNTITGCYEGEEKYFDNCASALKDPNIMDDVSWLLLECQYRKILSF